MHAAFRTAGIPAGSFDFVIVLRQGMASAMPLKLAESGFSR
jgi:hypothetical protein